MEMDENRIDKVISLIDGTPSEMRESEWEYSILEKVYTKLLNEKDSLYYLKLNDRKYKVSELKVLGTCDALQITLENNMVIIFDETNIDFFIINAMIAVYQPFTI